MRQGTHIQNPARGGINLNSFTEVIGVGYDYHDVRMNVLPLFEDKKYATELWKSTFETLEGNQIRIRFVEHETNYWLIVYANDSRRNIDLVKNVPMSDNYLKFKDGFVDKVILRFAIYKNADIRGTSNKKYHFEVLRKSKVVENIRFLQYSELSEDSIEKQLIEDSQKQ